MVDILRHSFTLWEVKVLMVILRKGLLSGKDEAKISHRAVFCAQTGLRSDHVLVTLEDLERARVLEKIWRDGVFQFRSVDQWKKDELSGREDALGADATKEPDSGKQAPNWQPDRREDLAADAGAQFSSAVASAAILGRNRAGELPADRANKDRPGELPGGSKDLFPDSGSAAQADASRSPGHGFPESGKVQEGLPENSGNSGQMPPDSGNDGLSRKIPGSNNTLPDSGNRPAKGLKTGAEMHGLPNSGNLPDSGNGGKGGDVKRLSVETLERLNVNGARARLPDSGNDEAGSLQERIRKFVGDDDYAFHWERAHYLWRDPERLLQLRRSVNYFLAGVRSGEVKVKTNNGRALWSQAQTDWERYQREKASYEKRTD